MILSRFIFLNTIYHALFITSASLLITPKFMPLVETFCSNSRLIQTSNHPLVTSAWMTSEHGQSNSSTLETKFLLPQSSHLRQGQLHLAGGQKSWHNPWSLSITIHIWATQHPSGSSVKCIRSLITSTPVLQGYLWSFYFNSCLLTVYFQSASAVFLLDHKSCRVTCRLKTLWDAHFTRSKVWACNGLVCPKWSRAAHSARLCFPLRLTCSCLCTQTGHLATPQMCWTLSYLHIFVQHPHAS